MSFYVERSSPNGNADAFCPITIRFNKSVIPLTSVAKSNELIPPIEIKEISTNGTQRILKDCGEWRWEDTQMLKFRPKKWTYGLSYSLTIKKNALKSIENEPLAYDFEMYFQVIPIRIDSIAPRNFVVPENQIFIVRFPYAITEQDHVFGKLGVKDTSNKFYKIARVKDPKEIEEWKKSKIQTLLFANNWELQEYTQAHHFTTGDVLAFKMVDKLPLATTFQLVFEKQEISFSTYGEMKLSYFYPYVDTRITKNIKNFSYTFTNFFDPDNKPKLTCDPEMPKMKQLEYIYNQNTGQNDKLMKEAEHVSIGSNNINYCGETKALKKYTITIDNIQDIFGQKSPKVEKTIIVHPLDAQILVGYDERNVIDTSRDYPQVFSVNALNVESVRMKIFHIQDKDLPEYRLQDYERKRDGKFNGKLFKEMVLKTNCVLDEFTVFNYPLPFDILQNPKERCGQIEISVEAEKYFEDSIPYYNAVKGYNYRKWFQFTKYSLDCFGVKDFTYFSLTNMENGDFCTNAELFSLEGTKIPFTIENNLYKVKITDLEKLDSVRNYRKIMSKIKNDITISEVILNYIRDSEQLFCFLFDDQKIYQPGGSVNIKGIIRKSIIKGTTYQITYPEKNQDVHYEIKDSCGVSCFKGSEKTNNFGAFNFVFNVPKDCKNLGDFSVVVTFISSTFYHSFKVEEFKSPKFLVSVKCDKPQPPNKFFFSGEEVTCKCSAMYLDNTPLKAPATVTWKAQRNILYHTPKEGYNFSTQTVQIYDEWDEEDYYDRRRGRYHSFENYQIISQSQPIGANGVTSIKINPLNIGGVCCPFGMTEAYDVDIVSEVKDSDNSVITSQTKCSFYGCDRYVGIKFNNRGMKKGDKLDAEFVVVDLEGNMVPNYDFEVKIHSVNDNKIILEKKCKSVLDPLSFLKFHSEKVKEFDQSGEFHIMASLKDTRGNVHSSQTNFNISEVQDTGVEGIALLEAEMTPNQKSYKPGEEAKILVHAPFDEKSKSSGVVFGVLEGADVIQTFKIDEKDNCNKVVTIPLSEDSAPNMKVYLTMFGTKTNLKINKPITSHAKKEIELNISLDNRVIPVKASFNDKVLSPGATCKMTIDVGKGDYLKSTEVFAIIVDKSVLSLTHYQLSDPLKMFYKSHSGYLNDFLFRTLIKMKIVTPEEMDNLKQQCCCTNNDECCKCEEKKCCECDDCEEECCEKECEEKECCKKRCCSKGKDFSPPKPQPVTFRKDFRSLAYFNASIVPDSKSGLATVEFKMPESLSSYTVWIGACSEKKFGLYEDSIMTDLAFQVESRFPQFMNLGDSIQLGLMLYNKTNSQKSVIIVSEFGEQIEIDKNNKEKKMILPPKEKTLCFITATAKIIGECKCRVFCRDANGSDCDAFEETLNVMVPKVMESFASYGETDKEKDTIVNKVGLNVKEVYKEIGGCSLRFTSTAMQQLTDAFLYLYHYEFDCSEQISSKVIGILTVGQVLEEFNIAGCPSSSDMEKVIKAAIVKYRNSQKSDGGFGYWSESPRSYPYVSTYIGMCLSMLANSKKYSSFVDKDMITKNVIYLFRMVEKCLEDKDDKDYWYYGWYGFKMGRSMACYGIYVLNQYFKSGMITSEQAATLLTTAMKIYKLNEEEKNFDYKLPMESLAWLLFVIAQRSKEGLKNEICEKIMNNLNNNVNETSATANFISKFSREEGNTMLNSSTKSDGIILEILCDLKPEKFMKLIPKIAKGLLSNRKKGMHWSNTQENSFVLIGVKKYFDIFESEVPNFQVKFTYDKNIIGDTKFKGRETKIENFLIPTKQLKENVSDLIVTKEGKGRMYYRFGVEYTPLALNLDKLDRGFIVSQEIEPVQEQSHLKKNGNIYSVKNGELYKITVKVTTETRRYNTVLISNIPSGFQIVNPSLEPSLKLPNPDYDYYNKKSLYPIHVNYRKDRVEAFNETIHDAGTYYFIYFARSIHSGSFILNPCSCTEMYDPDIFGRSQSETVQIL